MSYIPFRRGEDEPEGLFDSDLAEYYPGLEPERRDPDTYWEASLYLTAEDQWVMNILAFGPENHHVAFYTLVEAHIARLWLEANNYPEVVNRYFNRPKGGRPGIGDKLITRVSARMYNQIADLSELYAEDMPETVRRLLGEALSHRETIGAPGSRSAT